MLAHSQGAFYRVVDFRIDTAAPAVTRSEQSAHKNDKNCTYQSYGTVFMLVSCCTNPKIITKTKHGIVLVRTCSYSGKIITQIQHGENQIQPSGTTFSNFSDNVAVPSRGRKLLSLCHTVVRAPKSPSPGSSFSDGRCGWSYGRITECRSRKIQRYNLEVLPVVDLFKKSTKVYQYQVYISCVIDPTRTLLMQQLPCYI